MTRISSRELTEWIAYSQVEPFGPEIDSMRLAMIPTAIANSNLPKNQKPFKIDDFMIKYGKESVPETQSVNDMKSILKLIATQGKEKVNGRNR